LQEIAGAEKAYTEFLTGCKTAKAFTKKGKYRLFNISTYRVELLKTAVFP
jgi:hypothetical protein